MPSIYPTGDANVRVSLNPIADSIIRVVVIEDSDDDQELLRRQLRRANILHNIMYVSEGHKAIDVLANLELKLLVAVFLDLKLKAYSGLDVLRKIRSNPETATLPIFVLTGSHDPKDIEECKRLNVTSYISKPIGYQAFCMAIANVFHLPK